MTNLTADLTASSTPIPLHMDSQTAHPRIKALFELSLDASTVIVSTLRDVGRLAPVPYLFEAAQLAVGILNTVQAIKDCEEGFQRLARDACGLVYAINVTYPNGAGFSRDLDVHIRQLVVELTSIFNFAKKRLRSRGVLKVIRSSSDRGKISEYREAIRQSLDVFSVKLNITDHQILSQVQQSQQEISQQQRARDSEHTLLLREILRHIRSVETNSPLPSTPPSPHREQNAEQLSPQYVAQPQIPPTIRPPVQPVARDPVEPFIDPTTQSSAQRSRRRSNNPFSHLGSERRHPSHTNEQRSPPLPPSSPWSPPPASGFAPYYHINGNYLSEDRSQHTQNVSSNNTTTHIVNGSNNSSFRGFGR